MVTMRYLCLMFIVVVIGAMADEQDEVSDDDPCCEVCPQFWTRFGGYCYRFFSVLKNWNDAEAHCQTFLNPSGIGHLVSVHSETENHYLFELQRTTLPRLTNNDVRSIQTWIGLNNGAWSDGSNDDYQYQVYLAANTNPCTYMTELFNGVNGWNKALSNVAKGRSYICKLPINSGN